MNSSEICTLVSRRNASLQSTAHQLTHTMPCQASREQKAVLGTVLPGCQGQPERPKAAGFWQRAAAGRGWSRQWLSPSWHTAQKAFPGIFISVFGFMWLSLGLELTKQLDLTAPAAVGDLTLDCHLRGYYPLCSSKGKDSFHRRKPAKTRSAKKYLDKPDPFSLHPTPALPSEPPQQIPWCSLNTSFSHFNHLL